MTRAEILAVAVSIVLTIAIFSSGCSRRSNPQLSATATPQVAPNPPKPGSLVDGTGAVPTSNLIMAQSAQFWPEFTLTSANVPFTLGVDEGGVIRYLATSDDRFLTPEGVHVGLNYRSVMVAANFDAVEVGIDTGVGHGAAAGLLGC